MTQINKGIIYGRGEYPLGSSALRLRMWHKGLLKNGINTSLIITTPSPSVEDVENSESFVHFMLSPNRNQIDTESKSKKGFDTIIILFKALLKSYTFLKNRKNDFDFVLLYSSNVLEGMLVKRFCRRNNKLLFIESCDENRNRFKKNRTFFESLAVWQEDLFEKCVIPKADLLLVVSEYLEQKFKKLSPDLKIRRSVPSYLNYEEFSQFQQNNLQDLKKFDFSVLNSKHTKLCFAGSCVFTNGLKFFLDAAAQLKDKYKFEIVFVFFKGNVSEIVDYASKLGIGERLHIFENIQFPYIPAIYSKSDILVLPEMGKTVANAGFPGKTSEYLASGKAIISTDFSNLKDILKNKENVMMSPLGDLETYTKNLQTLLCDPSLRAKLGVAALDTAIQYFDYKNGVMPLVNELNHFLIKDIV